MAVRNSRLVGTAGLVAVAGADHQHVGDRAQAGQGFDRLVGGAVFAQADGVVGEHVDHAQLTQGREAHGAHHVAREHREGAAVGHQAAAVVRQSIQDGRHGVLAHTEVQVAVGFSTLLETALTLDVGEVGVGEVGGAADQFRQDGADGVEAVVGVLAGGQAFVVGGVAGQCGIPPLGQFTAQLTLELGGLSGVLAAVVVQGGVPGILGGSTALDGLTPLVVRLLGNFEFSVLPTQVLAGEGGLIGPQGGTMHTGGVGLVGGAVADGGCHLDQRRPIGDGLGLFNGAGDPGQVGVAIGHMDGVPAVGLVALEHIFGEGNVGVSVDGDVVVVVQGNQLAQAQVPGQ